MNEEICLQTWILKDFWNILAVSLIIFLNELNLKSAGKNSIYMQNLYCVSHSAVWITSDVGCLYISHAVQQKQELDSPANLRWIYFLSSELIFSNIGQTRIQMHRKFPHSNNRDFLNQLDSLISWMIHEWILEHRFKQLPILHESFTKE